MGMMLIPPRMVILFLMTRFDSECGELFFLRVARSASHSAWSHSERAIRMIRCLMIWFFIFMDII